MEFRIEHTWDGLLVSHDPVTIALKSYDAGLLMQVSAPFFNDPPAPLGAPGKPFRKLWDYEVVEAFFLSDRSEQYLEVELCPHGQYLLLLLSGKRGVWKEELPLEFDVTRTETKWKGRAHLPWNYFPPGTNRFNAFAIHGSGEHRKYEALYPVPRHKLQEGQKPDFSGFCLLSSTRFSETVFTFPRKHGEKTSVKATDNVLRWYYGTYCFFPPLPVSHRLEFFQELNLKELMGEDWKQPESDIWKSHTR